MFRKEVEVFRKLAWYEIILSVFVFAPCVLFGAIGGAIGGALGFTNVMILRNVKKIYLKIIISILFMAAGLLLSYVCAVSILKAMAPLF